MSKQQPVTLDQVHAFIMASTADENLALNKFLVEAIRSGRRIQGAAVKQKLDSCYIVWVRFKDGYYPMFTTKLNRTSATAAYFEDDSTLVTMYNVKFSGCEHYVYIDPNAKDAIKQLQAHCDETGMPMPYDPAYFFKRLAAFEADPREMNLYGKLEK